MLLIGIDQSHKKHDVCITDMHGRQLARSQVGHDHEGFEQLDRLRQQLGVPASACWVAVESGHSLLVDFLLERGYQVYVIPGKAVDRYRDRHRQGRSRSDQGDAFVLANILRTDRARYVPLTADTALTQQLRSQVRLLLSLRRNQVRFGNQLRDLLWRYYPVATQVFCKLDQPLTLAFIAAYPTLQAAQCLSQEEYGAFCHAQGYYDDYYITQHYTKLQTATTCASAALAQAFAPQAQAQARVLQVLVREEKAAEKALSATFAQHPDASSFASLPGAGVFLAPALLSKFRDCRARFPSAAVVQAVAGTCPVTEQSGRKHWIHFRLACDREFRFIATQFARCSVVKSPWAAAYLSEALARCEKPSQAYRCLANRWLAIIWRLWTDRVAYDEQVHQRHRFANRKRS